MTIKFEKRAPNDFGSYIFSKVVIIPDATRNNQSEWTLFAFLHEIGHVKTNTITMKRCEQEFLATKWAMAEAKRIGFDVPPNYIKTYQEYILDWRERGIKCGAKTIPMINDLML